ncbi:MAG: GMC family oxidoreductase N-terminal domain-containing protein [Alphaproteobacteria bacterium]|nr:GMC family oxidoreductase N-terminal domain-containing protein [Alphaproteobacteria bacterium]
MKQGYDYIIIGSGSAGSLIANRLSADPACRVLVLEAGGLDRNPWLKLPVGYFRTIYDPRFSRVFKTEPSEGDGHRGIAWPRGRIVGGSSSINGLIYIRGQHEDFDDWQDMGATGWSWEDVLPHFRRIERYAGGDDQWHGRDGDMPVSDLRHRNPACEAWLAAAMEYGLPRNDDFNGSTTLGVGTYQLSLGRRFRASSASIFLKPALARGNVTLNTSAHVTRVLFDGTCATGVEWVAGGQTHQARAESEVILCAGSIQSPQILQLSGVGPAATLQRHGIAVVADSAEVGANLQDHYQMRQIVRLKKKWSLNDDVRNPVQLAKMGIDWALKGIGPLTVGAGQVGGGACTPLADRGRPDIQFNVMPLSVDKPGTPLHRYSGFTASFWQCHPESRGYVCIRSADPMADPLIAPNYLSTERDRGTMIAGVRILREIIHQPGFRDLWDKEMVPGEEVQSDAEILDAVRNMGGTVFHPTGTCRMGRDEHAVLDPELRVNGVEKLRVVDASAMPKITSANTNAPTYMIGNKGADMILQGLRRNAKSPEEQLA